MARSFVALPGECSVDGVDALWRLSDGRPRMRFAAVGVTGVARNDVPGLSFP